MSTAPVMVDLLKRMDPLQIEAFLSSLDEQSAQQILSSWELWRLPYQDLPAGRWRLWVFRAGRGTGKTHTGARTTTEVARDKARLGGGEIGIIGRTYTDARYTMVEGPSGILATAPPDFRPTWEPGNHVLTWPNGVRGRLFSADKPETLRGPNFGWIWGDEPAHWPDLKKVWREALSPALRSGRAQGLLTSTPIPGSYLAELEKLASTVVTRASTRENVYLPDHVRDSFRELYEGTSAGLQELEGEYLPENADALWRLSMIEDHRVKVAPELARIVVAVDPAVTAHEGSDETGIVVVGRGLDRHAYVLGDYSRVFSPAEWAREAVAAWKRHQADRIVAEVNNGGDLVEANILTADANAPVEQVRASRGKVVRAEPVAALAERGKIHHVGVFPELERQLCEWSPTRSRTSPDRLDALVWAVTELLLGDKAVGALSAYL